MVTTILRLVAMSAALMLATAVEARTACPATFAGGVEPVLVRPKLATSARLLCFRSFAVLHSGVTRTALWSAEHLTRASVEAARLRDVRDGGFHAEARLPPDERAELTDYARSVHDRGHMAPSGDTGDGPADRETFSLANMVPQAAALNRSGWSRLEGYVRSLAATKGDAYVVTGPLYEGATVERVGGRVLVPTSTWKALWVPGQGAGAWIATNTAFPRWQVVSIAQLTGRIGVDPFPTLEGATRSRVSAFPDFGGSGHGRRRR